ncbi:hypothetical protein GCM10011491_02140 [Brucella endophytica]|uniref:YjiS-like domain-containing protein n=1 Tax=Brucella endophytica TaxID=1963359 RepID=A0A916W9G4_9HYPH|nr:DUF1127 domain-containing protein [Brucella endophytica]GGA78543.1 hypothetical protein GCM10011491_02140 [Brucella endophytica]
MTTAKTMTIRTPAAMSGAAYTPMVVSVFGWVRRLFARYRNRVAILHLDDLDDHLLHDIGLSRSDLRAVRRSFLRDPSTALNDARALHEAARCRY